MRISFQIAIFLIVMHFTPFILIAFGLGDAIGFEPWVNPGGERAVQTMNESAQDTEFSQGVISTLFGLFIDMASAFQAFVSAIFAGPDMIGNVLRLPDSVGRMITVLLWLFVMVDTLFYAGGRE